MIVLFNLFSDILNSLKKLKEANQISKFYLSLNQNNTIDVIVVTNNIITRNDIVEADFSLIVLSQEELEEDAFYSNIFAKDDQVVSYQESRRKFNNLLNFVDESNYTPPCPIVTFYSYKGGMGRSTNLATQAAHLAVHNNKKVVIVDCDFEAPGFTNFFLEYPAYPKNNKGLIEYFFDSELDDKINVSDYSWEVSKKFSGNGTIYIVPAGNLDDENTSENIVFKTSKEQYLEGLARLDFSSSEYIIDKFKLLIENLNNELKPDIIFIDSRTGFTDIFGLTAIKLSTNMVGFFSNSVQNLPGLHYFIDIIKNINKPNFTGLLVNSFSKPKSFEVFKDKITDYINQTSINDEDFLLSIKQFYFGQNDVLARLGTPEEDIQEFIDNIEEKSFGKGYSEIGIEICNWINEFNSNHGNTIQDTFTISDHLEVSVIKAPQNDNIQNDILKNLHDNWPNLYGDSEKEQIDFDKELSKHRYYFRQCMLDIFNFDKFLILGNKGTGKSYIYQSLKNNKIVDELKKRAQKNNINYKFLHLVDKKDNFFLPTIQFDQYSKDNLSNEFFYERFWLLYTWSAIRIKLVENGLNYESEIEPMRIEARSTELIKQYYEAIKNQEKIIEVEKDLKSLDDFLNSKQIDLVVIYDNLDEMVLPHKWKDEIAPLVNFWRYSTLKKIHPKLFLRSDLFRKISGITNIKDLENNAIKIEWSKEEIFNYFFKLVISNSRDAFIKIIDNYNFDEDTGFDDGWKQEFKKKTHKDRQYDFDEFTLRRLCWAFFGKYPDIKAHGDSYDWLYKNVMNADSTISLRPFIDLIRLAIEEYLKDDYPDTSALLPPKYYTYKNVRIGAVERHFEDLVQEQGNSDLIFIFEYIDRNRDYQYFEFLQYQFEELLMNVMASYDTKLRTIQELEELLVINGIIRVVPISNGRRYTFAFLYKYRLGLAGRKRTKRRF